MTEMNADTRVDRYPHFLRRNPGLFPLAAVILTILPFTHEWPLWTASITACAAALLPLPLLGLRSTFFKCALPACLALLSVYLTAGHDTGDPILKQMYLPSSWAEMELQIDDPSAAPGVDFLPAPKRLKARVERYRLSGETEWQEPARTTHVMLAVRKTAAGFIAGYGDRYRMAGHLTEAESGNEFSGYDDREYLKRQGITLNFRARDIEKLENGSGVYRTLLNGRDWMLRRISGNMKSPDAQALSAGILFGLGQGIDSGKKQDFIRSGTIHILTVSGTHVGLFALLMMMLFAVLPLRLRCIAVIILTFFYTWMTGMHEPSFRAFMMLTFYLSGKIFMRRSSGLNTLILAATVLLLQNPHNLVSQGFQFSFLTVAALIASSRPLQALFNLLEPSGSWVPSHYRSKWYFLQLKLKHWLFFSVTASLIAFAAGIALAAWHNLIFSSASPVANLLLLPLVWLCFAASGLVLTAGPELAFIPEQLLLLTESICRTFSESGVFDFAEPPLWSVIAFMLIFFLLFAPWKGKWAVTRLVLLTASALLPVWWYLRAYSLEPELMIIHGTGTPNNIIALAVTDPDRRTSCIINMPDYDSAALASGFLKSRGISQCSKLAVQNDYVECIKGAKYLYGIRIHETVLSKRQKPHVPEAVRIVEKNGNFSGFDLQTETCGGIFKFRISSSANCRLNGEIEKLADGSQRVTIYNLQNEILYTAKLKPSNCVKYQLIKIGNGT